MCKYSLKCYWSNVPSSPVELIGGEGLNLITISHKKRMFKIYVYKD